MAGIPLDDDFVDLIGNYYKPLQVLWDCLMCDVDVVDQNIGKGGLIFELPYTTTSTKTSTRLRY